MGVSASTFPVWAFLCIAVGLFMIFWHNRQSGSQSETTSERAGGPSDAPVKGDDFAEDALSVLNEVRPDLRYVYDGSDDIIRGYDAQGSAQHSLALTNLRNRCSEMGRVDRRAYLVEFAGQFEGGEITPDDRGKLMIRCRTEAEMQMRELHRATVMRVDQSSNGTATAKPLIRTIHDLPLRPELGRDAEIIGGRMGDILLQPVIDQPTSLMTLQADSLEKLEMTAAQAMDAAKRNMLASLLPPEQLWERMSEHVFLMESRDDYEVARLVVLADELPTPNAPIGDLVCYFPAHNVCLVSTSREAEALAEMIALGDEMAQSHRPFSAALWQFRPDGWFVFDPRTTFIEPAHVAAARERLSAYTDQRESVTKRLADHELDVFVPDVMAYRKTKEGPVTTAAVWIGAGTLMPVVDIVHIPDPIQAPGQAPGQAPAHARDADPATIQLRWSDFAAIIGIDAMSSFQALNPPRYYFDADATAEQAHALAAAAIDDVPEDAR